MRVDRGRVAQPLLALLVLALISLCTAKTGCATSLQMLECGFGRYDYSSGFLRGRRRLQLWPQFYVHQVASERQAE
jgi:hypothetical protein